MFIRFTFVQDKDVVPDVQASALGYLNLLQNNRLSILKISEIKDSGMWMRYCDIIMEIPEDFFKYIMSLDSNMDWLLSDNINDSAKKHFYTKIKQNFASGEQVTPAILITL